MDNHANMDFLTIWSRDQAALIDPFHKVCLGVSRKVAEHLDEPAVKEMLNPIWKQQVEIQRKIAEQQKINTVYLMVTRRCNLSCDFCAMNADQYVDTDAEMGLEQITQKVIPFLKKNNPRKLIITGGEPLMKKDILKIVGMIRKELDSFMILQSNGTHITEEFLEGIQGNIDEIDFSTKHMLKSEEKVNQLKDHIALFQSRNIKVVLSFVYEKGSESELYKVIDIAADYNTELLVTIVSPVGRARNQEQRILTETDQIEMNTMVAKHILAKGYLDKAIFNSLLRRIQVINSCGAYGKVMAIFPEGNVYMCQCLEEEQFKLGDVLSEDSESIEKTHRFLLDQEYVKESLCVDSNEMCKRCDYRYLCGGKCSAAAEKETDGCYYVKRMIDFRLFYTCGKDRAAYLEDYISYLENIRHELISGEEKVQQANI